ncbi:MAG: GPR endopeptidase [Ruminococcaceae bacterium]|nr:GPR endopeptidase [Oscillospiraceae bacterium]
MQLRTDLALEGIPEKSRVKRVKYGCIKAELCTIGENERDIGFCGGDYLTVDVGELWKESVESLREKTLSLALAMRELFGELAGKRVMVAGLGNRHITADALGPLAVENTLVTSHIKKEKRELFESLGLEEVCAICPGVLGQTGIESATVIKSVCSAVKPDIVIAVDALAAHRTERLGRTVQISSCGFSPGAGVGNVRSCINSDTLGCRVVTVGVPTVVSALTLAGDLGEPRDKARRWQELFVTPKESDTIIKTMGVFIGHGINLALNPELDYDTMLSLAAV